MPELPEVETTRRAVERTLQGRTLRRVVMRRPNLRWPMPADLPHTLKDAQLISAQRRGKYLLLFFRSPLEQGWLMVHLGMSGSLCEVSPAVPAGKHDHVDFDFGDVVLRYNDPRRFGAILWFEGVLEAHPETPLLASLGVEPMTDDFSPQSLYASSRGVSTPIKQWLLAGKSVVGVGNIYCSESLFYAGIHPAKAAGRLTKPQSERLHTAIRNVLGRAIAAGGTTLNDFASGAHIVGNFQTQVVTYGRAGQPCVQCGQAIKTWLKAGKPVGGRATYFCGFCQK